MRVVTGAMWVAGGAAKRAAEGEDKKAAETEAAEMEVVKVAAAQKVGAGYSLRAELVAMVVEEERVEGSEGAREEVKEGAVTGVAVTAAGMAVAAEEEREV